MAWLLCVLAVIFLQGFNTHQFHLSDSVLVTLIPTTTANVLGLVFIVAKYLFPKSNG